MSRIELLARRPKSTLAVLALVLLAVGVVVGTGANFSATAANPNNSFTAGSLSIGNTPNTALFTVTNWKPGDTSTGTVDIENTGSISGTFTLSRTNLVDTPASPGLSNVTDMVVKDCGTDLDCSAGTNPTIYSGTLNAMSSAIALGTFAAGEERRYEFTATFNSSAGDTYQSANTTATFRWDATQ